MVKPLTKVIFKGNCDRDCLDDIEVEVNILDRDFTFLSSEDGVSSTIILSFEKAELLARNILLAIDDERLKKLL